MSTFLARHKRERIRCPQACSLLNRSEHTRAFKHEHIWAEHMPTCAYAHVSILGRNAFEAHQQARAHSLSSGLQLTEPCKSICAAFDMSMFGLSICPHAHMRMRAYWA